MTFKLDLPSVNRPALFSMFKIFLDIIFFPGPDFIHKSEPTPLRTLIDNFLTVFTDQFFRICFRDELFYGIRGIQNLLRLSITHKDACISMIHHCF